MECWGFRDCDCDRYRFEISKKCCFCFEETVQFCSGVHSNLGWRQNDYFTIISNLKFSHNNPFKFFTSSNFTSLSSWKLELYKLTILANLKKFLPK